jgi:hypothetical protein
MALTVKAASSLTQGWLSVETAQASRSRQDHKELLGREASKGQPARKGNPEKLAR